MHITNMGKGSRVLPLKNGRQIEIAPGQTVDFPHDEWAALAKRVTVRADIEAGEIVAVGAKTAPDGDGQAMLAINADLGTVTVAALPEAPEPKRRGRPPKAKPDGDVSGEDA